MFSKGNVTPDLRIELLLTTESGYPFSLLREYFFFQSGIRLPCIRVIPLGRGQTAGSDTNTYTRTEKCLDARTSDHWARPGGCSRKRRLTRCFFALMLAQCPLQVDLQLGLLPHGLFVLCVPPSSFNTEAFMRIDCLASCIQKSCFSANALPHPAPPLLMFGSAVIRSNPSFELDASRRAPGPGASPYTSWFPLLRERTCDGLRQLSQVADMADLRVPKVEKK